MSGEKYPASDGKVTVNGKKGVTFLFTEGSVPDIG